MDLFAKSKLPLTVYNIINLLYLTRFDPIPSKGKDENLSQKSFRALGING